jgi:hypothetical protein
MTIKLNSLNFFGKRPMLLMQTLLFILHQFILQFTFLLHWELSKDKIHHFAYLFFDKAILNLPFEVPISEIQRNQLKQLLTHFLINYLSILISLTNSLFSFHFAIHP